jgi:hypothetical protein
MKIRIGFVSNSSSSSFIIHNKTNESQPLSEFVMEAERVVLEYIEERSKYGMFGVMGLEWRANDKPWTIKEIILKQMTKDAKRLPPLKPGANTVIFGDEQGSVIGQVYDYALRDGGSTERFGWSLKEYLR